MHTYTHTYTYIVHQEVDSPLRATHTYMHTYIYIHQEVDNPRKFILVNNVYKHTYIHTYIRIYIHTYIQQEVDNPRKFVLVEVYSNADAPAKHKETAHYAAWRDGVADMMAEPR